MRLDKTGRWAVAALVAGSMSAGGIAVASSGGPGNSGGTKPGKGCGDKNHVHYRESECKKPPK